MINQTRFQNLRHRWEERARRNTTTLRGVLCQGLSAIINEYINKFHIAQVKKWFIQKMCREALVLDLGCGYGRISKVIRELRPDINLFGLDFAMNYCELYRKYINSESICGEIQALPFSHASFDGILAITSLMYVSREQRPSVTKQILDLIKPNGYILFVDPGQELMQAVSSLRPQSTHETTGGLGFYSYEYKKLIVDSGGEIIAYGGMPTFTLMLPVLIALEKVPLLQRSLLSFIKLWDNLFGHFWKFSLHRWIFVRKIN
ncbi:MAG: class I SAM-dependent methyltransferase [Candidatus Competibacteraceae bacterium]